MTVNLEQKGLSSVANQFDLFFIDIWGVVHNGINLYPTAVGYKLMPLCTTPHISMKKRSN